MRRGPRSLRNPSVQSDELMQELPRSSRRTGPAPVHPIINQVDFFPSLGHLGPLNEAGPIEKRRHEFS